MKTPEEIVKEVNDFFLWHCREGKNRIGLKKLKDNCCWEFCEYDEKENAIIFYSDGWYTGKFSLDDYSFTDDSCSWPDYVDYCQWRDYMIRKFNI